MYFFVIVFAAVYWIIYGNWIGGCLMASLFVVLAYSVCRCQSEQKQMILTIEMDSLVLTEGDEAEIRLRIHGITSKINSYTFRLEYEMTSKFRKQRMRKKKNIVWNPQEGDSITLSEMITECDSYHIQICSVSWEDLTGMYKVKKEFNKQISFLVMPKRYEMGFMQEKIARRDLMEQGFEYDGVRKYQEGDRISRVHWNLYAATGGLWVRKNEEEEEDKNKVEFKNLPIDEFLLLILNTYQSNSNGNIKYADLTSLFQNNQYSDQIMDIINKYIHDFKSEDNKLRSEILEEMNRLILINREE